MSAMGICVYSYSAIGNSNVNNPSHTNGNNDGVASSASDHNALIGIIVATLTSMAVTWPQYSCKDHSNIYASYKAMQH